MAAQGMISPYEPGQIREVNGKKIVSYGTSSYGYDMRIANEFKVFKMPTVSLGHDIYLPDSTAVLDPKNFDHRILEDVVTDELIIPPNGFALGRSVEYLKIPRNVITICLGKSTYARLGQIVNVTPFEPEWEGHVTIEISNSSPIPAKIYANEGIAQVLFFESDEQCKTSYADRGGKYQGQTGVTLART